MKKRILLDCDGVLANFCDFCFDFIEQNTGKRFTYEDVTDWDIFKALDVKYLEKDFRNLIASGGQCITIKPFPDAIDAISKLKHDFEVIIVTSPLHVNSWAYERTEWLNKFFGIKKEDVIFATKKEYVAGDIFLDDHFENCLLWKENNHDGISLLWNAPYNKDKLTKSAGVRRVYNWGDVISICKEEKQKGIW